MGNRRKKYSSSSSSSSSSSDSSSSSSSDSNDKHKKHPSKFKQRKERRDKRKRLRKYSDSSTSSDTEADYERKRLKKEIKREQRKAQRLKMKLKDKQIKLSNNPVDPSKDGDVVNESCDIPIDLMEQSKSMAPMTKEEWEKRQSVVKRVYDKETDRYRLVKGDGEILEEIVSRDKHLEINKKATQGDGLHFQTQLASTIKR